METLRGGRGPPGDSPPLLRSLGSKWELLSEEWTVQLPNAPRPGPTTHLSQMLQRWELEGGREHFPLNQESVGTKEGNSSGKRAQEGGVKGSTEGQACGSGEVGG